MNVIFDHSNFGYLEVIDALSLSIGEGSHYSENGIYPQSSIIITRKDSDPKNILSRLQPIYQNMLNEMFG
jgi:hypothetical protein